MKKYLLSLFLAVVMLLSSCSSLQKSMTGMQNIGKQRAKILEKADQNPLNLEDIQAIYDLYEVANQKEARDWQIILLFDLLHHESKVRRFPYDLSAALMDSANVLASQIEQECDEIWLKFFLYQLSYHSASYRSEDALRDSLLNHILDKDWAICQSDKYFKLSKYLINEGGSRINSPRHMALIHIWSRQNQNDYRYYSFSPYEIPLAEQDTTFVEAAIPDIQAWSERSSSSYNTRLRLFKGIFEEVEEDKELLAKWHLRWMEWEMKANGAYDKAVLHKSIYRNLLKQYANTAGELYVLLDFGLKTISNEFESSAHLQEAKVIFDKVIKLDSQGNYAEKAKKQIAETITKGNFSYDLIGNNLHLKPSFIDLSYRNITNLEMAFYPVSHRHYELLYTARPRDSLAFQEILEGIEPLKVSHQLPETKDYRFKNTRIGLPELPMGNYIWQVKSLESNGGILHHFITVSDEMYVFTKLQDKGNYELKLLHKANGSPVSERKVMLELKYADTAFSVLTDENGVIPLNTKDMKLRTQQSFNYRNEFMAYSIHQEDTIFLGKPSWSDYRETVKAKDEVAFTTDRYTYQSGDSIQLKCFAFNEGKVLKNKSMTLYLMSLSRGGRIDIDSLAVTSNAFGTASASFFLNPSYTNGYYRIYAKDKKGNTIGSINVQKMDFVTPNFDLSLWADSSPNHYFAFGDTVRIKGKLNAYSGINVSALKGNAAVILGENLLAKPEVSLGEKGEFTIKIVPQHQNKYENEHFYEVVVSFSHISGERVEAMATFSACKKPSRNIGIPKKMQLKEGKKWKLKPRYEIQDTEVEGENLLYTIYRVRQPSVPLHDVALRPVDFHLINGVEWKERFPYYPFEQENKPENWLKEQKIASSYLTSGGENELQQLKAGVYLLEVGEGADKATTVLWVWPVQKGKLSFQKFLYSNLSDSTYQSAEDDIKIRFGTAAFDRHIYLKAVDERGRSIIDESYQLSKAEKEVSFSIPENAVGQKITGKLMTVVEGHLYRQDFVIKYQKTTFELIPQKDLSLMEAGKPYQKSFKIKGDRLDWKDGEALAWMYDASLESISNQYNKNWFYKGSRYDLNLYLGSEGLGNEVSGSFSYYYNHRFYKRLDYEFNEVAEVEIRNTPSNSIALISTQAEVVNEKLRKDDDFTAFFFPHLLVKNGQLDFDFNAPDGISKWKMHVLVHDESGRKLTYTTEIQNQKPLMLEVFQPMSLRAGDTWELKGGLFQQKAQSQQAQVVLKASDESAKVFSVQEKAVKLTGQENYFQFSLSLPDSLRHLRLAFSAQAGKHADGLQRDIPISPKMQKYEVGSVWSIPSESKEELSLANVLNREKEENISYELSLIRHPWWFVVADLPVLTAAEKPGKSYFQLINQFAAYHLMDYLKSQEMVSDFVQNYLSHEGEKPERIQNRAKMKALAESLSANHYHQKLAVKEKLLELQANGDGMAWFPGGQSSNLINRHFIKFLNRLEKYGIDDAAAYEMTKLRESAQKALQATLEKQLKQESPNINALLSTAEALANSSDARDLLDVTFIDTFQAKGLSLQNQGRWAKILWSVDRQKEASNLVDAMLKRSQYDVAKGRWWEGSQIADYGSQRLRFQMDMIQLLGEMGKAYEGKKEELIQYLLYQKQTVAWNNDILHQQGLWAIMEYGKELQSGEVESAILSDSEKEDLERYGFLLKSLNPEEKAHQKIVVESPSGMLWASLNWKFWSEPEVAGSGGEVLKVSRKFKESVDGLAKNVPDKITQGGRFFVELTIESERDLSFVEIRDQRAGGMLPMLFESGYRYQNGEFFYEEVNATEQIYYFTTLRAGKTIIQYEVYWPFMGDFLYGNSTAKSLYVPEISAFGEGKRVRVISD